MRVVRLSDDYVIKPFDCGNDDLNNFLLEDAKSYLRHLLSVTYLIETNSEIVAFFSVSNDKIAVPDSDKATWRRIKKAFPHAKHRSDYPAVKIGRLGVSLKFQHERIGSDILNFIKEMFATNNRTGCIFVTVDALKSAAPFYLKNGFSYLDKSTAEKEQVTYLLYFDLRKII